MIRLKENWILILWSLPGEKKNIHWQSTFVCFIIDKIPSYYSYHNKKIRVERMKKTTEYLLSITKKDQNGTSNFFKGIFQFVLVFINTIYTTAEKKSNFCGTIKNFIIFLQNKYRSPNHIRTRCPRVSVFWSYSAEKINRYVDFISLSMQCKIINLLTNCMS